MKFEWDRKKEKSNIEKHGVSFEQASYVFADPFALNRYDDEHSQEEDRWVLLGKSLNEIILVVVHTLRDDEQTEVIRIISARRATKQEKHVYHKKGYCHER
uniref:BrnT family toxin n=1 Tax=Candidatus Electronema sp. TaxID=2698783 RepID=UPI0040569B9C